MTHHIVLVGLSGAGKSSAGKAAAAKAGVPFVDLDEEIAAASGKTIPAMFDAWGEPGFREIETVVTETVLARNPAVIATGAGWIATARNRALLLSRGRIIYLRVGAQTAAARLGEHHGRPMLVGGATIERLRQLEAERAALYELADATIDTEGLSLQQVTDKLADLIKVFRGEK